MTEAGHEVSIVAGRGAQTDAGVPFISIPLVDSRAPEMMAAKQSLDRGEVPAHFAQLVGRLKDELGPALAQADKVIAHNVCSLNKNLALTAALFELAMEREPGWMMLWHHDLAWTTPRYRNELHEGYPWDLLRTAWAGVRQVTISEFRRVELAELMGIPREEIRVIPNGVNPEEFLKLNERTARLARELHLWEQHPLLLLPVRITPRKNIELAIRVTAVLRDWFPEAGLVVTGPPGPHNAKNAVYLQGLRDLRAELGLEGTVHFLADEAGGPLTDEVVGDLYRVADALFMPSREEGFGIPVLEAGLAGLSAFCADIPPLRELGEGCADFFSLEANPEQVAEIIAGRMESSQNFRLRRRVLYDYTWERVYREKIAPLLEEG
jgi:glycosyltransferase involved in cell wall biosynthesis